MSIKATVAIVDDNLFMRELLKDILERNNFKVVAEFKNANKFIESFATLNAQIVTMDIVMDKINGLQALKKVMDINNDAKIIMISTVGEGEIMAEALQLGAVDYITKPFSEKEVVAILSKHVQENTG
ncbi:response regulator [Candidatus Riflebacteria bacterium]